VLGQDRRQTAASAWLVNTRLEDVTILPVGLLNNTAGAADLQANETVEIIMDQIRCRMEQSLEYHEGNPAALCWLHSADGRDRLDVGIARSSRANREFGFGKAEDK